MKYIIDFKDDSTDVEIENWLTTNIATTIDIIESSGKVYLIETNTHLKPSRLVDTITMDTDISSQLLGTVEIIPLSTGAITSFGHDTDWWKTASCANVDFTTPETQFEPRGSNSIVYILDSGVNQTHVDLVNAKIVDLFSFTDDHTDTTGHGTALASIVVGQTCGITNSTLKSVKIFDKSATTMLSDIVRALDIVLTDIVANANSISVVNMSWAIVKNDYVETKIQRLLDVGAIVVAAAGNSGIAIENVTPASMANVLTVGAYDSNFAPADFSDYTGSVATTTDATNYGTLDVWAPGVDIKAALLDGTIGNISGTSASAAIMTACLTYNSDMSYTTTGPSTKAAKLMILNSMGKHGLLVLSDKYASNVNAVATFMPHPTSTLEFGTGTITNLIYANIDNSVFVAHNTLVSKIELSIDLPEGLTLSNGWIVGTLTTPPTSTQILEFSANITYTTGTINDYTARLYLLAPDVPVGDYPTDVTLLEFCSGSGGSCSGVCEAACFSCSKSGPCMQCGTDCP